MLGAKGQIWASLAVMAGWTAFVLLWQWGGLHYDLNALYLAGHFLAEGQLDRVYAIDQETFPLTNHPDWLALSEAWGCEFFCAYPFVYPPLWAVLAAPLTGLSDLHGFSNAALLVQIPLFALTPLLAWRLWRPEIGLAKWTFRCLFLATVCSMGTTSLVNNQPQLLVTFLLLLAFERAAYDRPWLGGLALGLAAGIKIYPAVFALIWVWQGNWRAVAGTALGGGALLLLNFAVAPWELQLAFLDSLSTLSATAYPAAWNYSLMSALGWFYPGGSDPFTAVSGIGAVERAAGPALLLFGLAWIFWRSRGRDTAWSVRFALPAMIALSTLATPLGWAYYLFIPLFALQLLPETRGRSGQLVMLVAVLLVFLPAYILLGIGTDTARTLSLLGAAFTVLCFLAFTLMPVPAVQRAGYCGAASTA